MQAVKIFNELVSHMKDAYEWSMSSSCFILFQQVDGVDDKMLINFSESEKPVIADFLYTSHMRLTVAQNVLKTFYQQVG